MGEMCGCEDVDHLGGAGAGAGARMIQAFHVAFRNPLGPVAESGSGEDEGTESLGIRKSRLKTLDAVS
jgi:hypothetical protein